MSVDRFEAGCRHLRELRRTAGKRREAESLEHHLLKTWQSWWGKQRAFGDGMVVHLVGEGRERRLKFGRGRSADARPF